MLRFILIALMGASLGPSTHAASESAERYVSFLESHLEAYTSVWSRNLLKKRFYASATEIERHTDPFRTEEVRAAVSRKPVAWGQTLAWAGLLGSCSAGICFLPDYSPWFLVAGNSIIAAGAFLFVRDFMASAWRAAFVQYETIESLTRRLSAEHYPLPTQFELARQRFWDIHDAVEWRLLKEIASVQAMTLEQQDLAQLTYERRALETETYLRVWALAAFLNADLRITAQHFNEPLTDAVWGKAEEWRARVLTCRRAILRNLQKGEFIPEGSRDGG